MKREWYELTRHLYRFGFGSGERGAVTLRLGDQLFERSFVVSREMLEVTLIDATQLCMEDSVRMVQAHVEELLDAGRLLTESPVAAVAAQPWRVIWRAVWTKLRVPWAR